MHTPNPLLVFFVGLGLLAVGTGPGGQKPKPAPDPIELHIDAARARADGSVVETATDEAVGQALLGLVRWRLGVADIEAKTSILGEVLRVVPARPSEEASVRRLLASLGACEFFLVAEKDDLSVEELLSFMGWSEAHPAEPLLAYNADPERPSPRVAWLPTRFGDKEGQPMPVLLPSSADMAFGSADFARVFSTPDGFGYPAIGFELLPERSDDFETFTGEAVKRRMAIVLGGTVRSAPTLETKLIGSGIIEGRFGKEEVDEIIEVLQGTGSALQLVPASPR